MRLVVNHWIQRADFSSDDFGEADQSMALRLLREHPWPEELKVLDRRGEKGEECCPPGLGLVAANDEILHFCPVGDGRWMVHFHYRESYGILGIILSKRDRLKTFMDVSSQQAEQMLAQFFSGQLVTLDARE